jgi:hypothetical protein
MMPIPYAFNLLGWSLGSAMLVGVALVSYWTMAVMVQVGRGGGVVHRSCSQGLQRWSLREAVCAAVSHHTPWKCQRTCKWTRQLPGCYMQQAYIALDAQCVLWLSGVLHQSPPPPGCISCVSPLFGHAAGFS